MNDVNVSQQYTKIKTLEILDKAAENPSNGMGALIGAGIGVGAGLPLGKNFAENMLNPRPSAHKRTKSRPPSPRNPSPRKLTPQPAHHPRRAWRQGPALNSWVCRSFAVAWAAA